MRWLLTGLLVALIGLPVLGVQDGQDKPQAEKPTPAAEQFQALVKEYQKKEEALNKAFDAATTDKEKAKLFGEYQKLGTTFAGRFHDLAQKSPKDPIALDALNWVLENNPGAGEVDKAIDLLLRDHVRNERMGDLAQQLAFSESKAAEKLLRGILDQNPSREVQALACFSLGQYLKGRTESADLSKEDLAKLSKEAEKVLEQVIAKYGDIKQDRGTLADNAKSELFELRNLGIGRTALEIEAEDIAGKKFKLSDYRGKVVLLDFWGHW